MSFSLDRRRRRRRRLVWVLGAIGVLLVIAYTVTRVQSTEAARRAYLDTALEVADRERDASQRFEGLVVGLEDMERPSVVGALDDVEEQVNLAVGDLGAAGTPEGSLGTAAVYLDVATDSWRDGVGQVKEAILALSEDSTDQTGLLRLERGLTELAVGDAAYADFLEVLAAEEIDLEGRVFPAVTFISLEQPELFTAGNVARRLLLSDLLGVVRDVAVSDLNLDPSPAGEQGGLPVVPFSETLDAAVTVANRGNVAVAAATVRLELVSNEGDFADFEQVTGALQPGELTSVLFADLPVRPGPIYQLTVMLDESDDDRTNDQIFVVFIRNADA